MKVMISCGEPSGDMYAGALAGEIRKIDPAADIFGFGSDRLKAGGARLIGDFRGLSVTGLSEAISVLPKSLAMYRRLVGEAKTARPDVFVAVDFPDFNFRVGGALKRLGIPVVYYISPQLWAWRPWRLRKMKRFVDRVLVIFPFEEAIYRDAGMPVDFVGHPLLDLLAPPEQRDRFLTSLSLVPSAPTVALLPGSRPNEVASIFPDLLRAAALIRHRVPQVQFVVARPPNLGTSHYGAAAELPEARNLQIRNVQGRTDDVLASCDVVLTASGTATVQAAIHERPMVIVYRLSGLTYRFGKPFVRVNTYGMANLIAGKPIVPELIQDAFTPDAVAAEAISFLTDPDRTARTRGALRAVREKLGGAGASRRAAAAIMEVATRSHYSSVDA